MPVPVPVPGFFRIGHGHGHGRTRRCANPWPNLRRAVLAALRPPLERRYDVAMARVLITGATGFIGGTLARRLREEGRHEILAPAASRLDLLSPGARAAEETLGRVELVVHCAASRQRADPSPRRFVDEIAMNVDATARLYDWAREARVSAIVHLSTLSVLRPLDDVEGLLDESSPTVVAPTHPYGLTKRWGEELAISLRPSFDCVAIVRPGMAYGRGQSDSSGMGRLASAIQSGQPHALAAPRGDRYAPVFIDDVVDVLARLVERPSNLLVNVGGPTPLFEREMVGDLARALGRPVDFVESSGEKALGFAPSTALVDRSFPGRTRTPWTDGVRRAFGG